MSDASTSAPSPLARPDYIDDGCNFSFTIPASQEPGRVHGELSGSFRPCYGIDRERLIDARDSMAKYCEVVIAAMPKYINSWSLTDRSGKAVPVTSAALERLHPALRDKLSNVVFFDFQEQVEEQLKNLP